MADILFRPQCDDDEDDDDDNESDKWSPACVTCLYKQIITYIWSNVDKNRQWVRRWNQFNPCYAGLF